MNSEQVIWRGTSSQIVNFWWFVLCILIVPIPWAVKKWLDVKCRTYEITSERLRVRSGILSKRTDEMELYRVKDITLFEPFFMRLFRVGNVTLDTSDRTTPKLILPAIHGPQQVRDELRQAVEKMRMLKRVREVDFADDDDLE